jgi:hypothetical protein
MTRLYVTWSHHAELELEEQSIDDYLDYVAPLYRRSLMTKYDRVGGLDDYLTEKFLSTEPADFAAALRRLRMAWEHSVDLAQANPPEPEAQCTKVQVRTRTPVHCLCRGLRLRGRARPRRWSDARRRRGTRARFAPGAAACGSCASLPEP